MKNMSVGQLLEEITETLRRADRGSRSAGPGAGGLRDWKRA